MADNRGAIELCGQVLSLGTLYALERGELTFTLCPAAKQRCEKSYQALVEAHARGQAIYGVTLGVGALKTTRFNGLAQHEMTTSLCKAHAAAIGAPYPAELVRLALIIKLNQAMSGQSGLSIFVAQSIKALIKNHITPEVGSYGSIGCADLLPNAQLALALCGEGFGVKEGRRAAMAELLAEAGLSPLQFHLKDSLALLSHNALSIAHAALCVRRAVEALDLLLAASSFAAATMQASPAPWKVAALRSGSIGLIGQWLTELHGHTAWPMTDMVHDPLHMRFIPEVFGPIYDSIAALQGEVEALTAHLDENPLVVNDEVVTSGGSHCLGLALKIETLRLALGHGVRNGFNHAQAVTSGRRGSLSINLVASNQMTGFGPFLKLCGSFLAEAMSLCAPVSATPLWLADGLEDEALFHPLSLSKLDRQIELVRMIAKALMVLAAQAHDLNPFALSPLHQTLKSHVRQHIAFMQADRPLGTDFTALLTSQDPHLNDTLLPLRDLLTPIVSAPLSDTGRNFAKNVAPQGVTPC